MTPSLTSADAAFARYEAIRHRLPTANFAAAPRILDNLVAAAAYYDGFLLDAFGVLNVGETAIPGAIARIKALRTMGKGLCVLTNAASYDRAGIEAKFARLGYDFAPEEIVSSRDVAVSRLETIAPGASWAAITAAHDDLGDITAPVTDAVAQPDSFEQADAILFLSTARWNAALHHRLIAALLARPRPVVVANPDLTAPNEQGFSQEPGLFGHDLADKTAATLHWFGKPFAAAFQDGLARLGLPAHRVAMVGDTLHTDILGGKAAGCGTVLVADHGLFRGLSVARYCAASGIVPDVIIPTT
jgi:glycerol-1-phosphatase